MISQNVKRYYTFIFLLVAGTLFCCSSGSKRSFDYSVPDAKSVRPTTLSREMAAIRSRQISRASYSLWFGLDETHADFQGRVVVNFELKAKASDASNLVFIDFEDGTIHSLAINGVRAKDPASDAKRYDGHRIRFEVSELSPGTNRVELAFSHAFSKDGMGLYRFKDPTDGLVYLYSNLEPYGAHRIFPCFDQPDLKASYELTVEAPEEWEVIANTSERDISRVDGRSSWAFPPSPIFSTYVFALHAGPYHSWKSDADGVALRLFARRSLAKDVDYSEWFDITRKGIEFFNSNFGYPYPYSKYDQVLVPDFSAIGMENVAAST
ncbi:MAG: M1 family aminopeptidase, partial [Bdellovibrionota bacterium]